MKICAGNPRTNKYIKEFTMNNSSTIEKMKELRLHGMTRAFTGLLEAASPGSMDAEETVAHLVEAESEERQFRKTKRLTRAASFRTRALMAEIDFRVDRGMDKKTILGLADCTWVLRGKSIVITGPTGIGKSYVSQALGTQACLLGMRTMYFNCSKLFPILNVKRNDGSLHNFMRKISKTELLILDDFGLYTLNGQDRLALLEIIEDRYKIKGTVIASQVPVSKWFDVIGDPTIADAICDRIIPQAMRINMSGKSMRRKKSNDS